MRPSSLLLLAFLLPAAASAQTLTVQIQTQQDLVVSANDCSSQPLVTWTLSTATVACSELTFWVTTGSCGDEPAAGDKELESYGQTEWGTVTSGQFRMNVSDLPGFATPTDGGAGGCGVPDREIEHKLCAFGEFGNTLGCTPLSGSELPAVKASPTPTITYDSLPPGVPGITRVASLDRGLRVELELDDDTAAVRVELGPAGTETFDRREEFSGEIATVRIEGLENGTEYQVRAIAIDGAGNESAPSEVQLASPVLTEGFFGAYKRAGGSELGGCAVATGMSVVPMGLVVLGLWLRRRQRR